MWVLALDPRPVKGQQELFAGKENRFDRLNRAMNTVNDRYGEFTVIRASLLHRSDMSNVIVPAWKSYGYRQTIIPTVAKMKIKKEME